MAAETDGHGHPPGWCEKLGVKNSEDAFHALLQQPLPGNLE